MRDDEIATKRLSDWKPETDIRLQKAFGKFVEEAGELLEVIPDIRGIRLGITNEPFENELADVLAFMEIIDDVCGGYFGIEETSEEAIQLLTGPVAPLLTIAPDMFDLYVLVGRVLAVVGRCQIQGLKGTDPETGKSNVERLTVTLVRLKILIVRVIKAKQLDEVRIMKRKQAKIDSKLPWVMGTATDLLPST